MNSSDVLRVERQLAAASLRMRAALAVYRGRPPEHLTQERLQTLGQLAAQVRLRASGQRLAVPVQEADPERYQRPCPGAARVEREYILLHYGLA